MGRLCCITLRWDVFRGGNVEVGNDRAIHSCLERLYKPWSSPATVPGVCPGGTWQSRTRKRAENQLLHYLPGVFQAERDTEHRDAQHMECHTDISVSLTCSHIRVHHLHRNLWFWTQHPRISKLANLKRVLHACLRKPLLAAAHSLHSTGWQYIHLLGRLFLLSLLLLDFRVLWREVSRDRQSNHPQAIALLMMPGNGQHSGEGGGGPEVRCLKRESRACSFKVPSKGNKEGEVLCCEVMGPSLANIKRHYVFLYFWLRQVFERSQGHSW